MTEPEAQKASIPLSSRVRGTAAREIDFFLARMSNDVYKDSSLGVAGWRPLSEQELRAANITPDMLVHTPSGFMARIYTDDNRDYALVFRGTDEGKDWVHNLKQGLGLKDVQYDMAERLSRTAYAAFSENLVITGHSLGGGLATLGSITSGAPAVTFNSSGLNDATIRHKHRDPDAVQKLAEAGQIRRYAVDGEILTSLQEEKLLTRALLPDAIGHKIELPDPDPQRIWEKLIPGSSLKHGLDLHGMDSVLEAQQQASRGSMANPAHPANGMFNEALAGLRGVQPNALGYASDDQYRNAAGSLVAKAREGGLHKIDHVVLGPNGSLFAVEGPLEDARHRIVSVDKNQAAQQPLEASSQAVVKAPREASAAIEPAMELQRRAALTP